MTKEDVLSALTTAAEQVTYAANIVGQEDLASRTMTKRILSALTSAGKRIESARQLLSRESRRRASPEILKARLAKLRATAEAAGLTLQDLLSAL